MSAITAAELEAQSAERQIQIIVHCDDLSYRDPIEACERSYRVARNVHKRHGLHKDSAGASQMFLAHLSPSPAVPTKTSAGPPCQLVYDRKTDVVTGVGVLGTGVAESDHQPGRGRGLTLDRSCGVAALAGSVGCLSVLGCSRRGGFLSLGLGNRLHLLDGSRDGFVGFHVIVFVCE